MGRLFAGTPLDRPPRCEHCGALGSACACPPQAPTAHRLDPAKQTARVRVEKRPRGKVATVVEGLDSAGNDLVGLGSRLKAACGSGGTVKGDRIEVQGDHREKVTAELAAIGYRILAR